MDFQIRMEEDWSKLSDKIKKNVLDINYTKYLQYQITAVIVSITFFVGIFVAFITKQLNPDNILQMSIAGFFSIIVLTPCAYYFLESRKHLRIIPKEIKKLKDF